MSLSNADKLALKAELTNDPQSLGLTTAPEDDEANANKLNLVRETINVRRRWLSTADLFDAVAPLEHQSLTSQQARYLDSVLSLGQIDPFGDPTIIGALVGNDGMFSSNSASYAAINAAIVQPGSRVQQLFQLGTLESGNDLTPSDVSQARQAT